MINAHLHILPHLSFTDSLKSSLADWNGEDRKEIPSCNSCLYTARLEQSLVDLAKGKKLRMTHLLGKLKYDKKYLFQSFLFI